VNGLHDLADAADCLHDVDLAEARISQWPDATEKRPAVVT